jgi:hypothetical protein
MPSINDFLSDESEAPDSSRDGIELGAVCNECQSANVLAFRTKRDGVYSVECQDCAYKKDISLGFSLD